ncbi:MAG: ketoacyl-ACP synthase III [Tannerella sp.]|jgi:3-oxoacyl-[acyl-carrier-protein] synthase-3|nr:ketoacyl-ACP synthase III [Tannerella sp.]
MYINASGYYVPEERVPNEYFLELNGLTDQWIVQRTGIVTRSRARPEENINTMGIEAIRHALPTLPYDIREVDLILSASYSPYDTVGTAAHVAQREFAIEDAKAFSLSSACSSFINALEIIEGYFASGKSQKALIICGDKNWAYSHPDDPQSGHLWGDASVAFFISKEQVTERDARVLEIYTQALGCLGKGPEGVQLRPGDGGIRMPEGKDVFVQACTLMPRNALRLLENNGYTWDDLSYFIAHQANLRIMKNIAEQIRMPEEKMLHNIEEVGNTGGASCALVYTQNKDRFKPGDLICLTVFGGGYSAGACLIRYN